MLELIGKLMKQISEQHDIIGQMKHKLDDLRDRAASGNSEGNKRSRVD